MRNRYRTYLRALELDDYKTTIEWRKNDKMWEMVGAMKHYVSSEYEKKWIQDRIFSKDYLTFACCLQDNNQMIGLISFTNMDRVSRKVQFFGKMIDETYWGKGYATEMLMQALQYLFYEQGFQRVYGYQLATNDYSMRVNEKCGAKVEGILRKSIFKNGEFCDERILAILREDFEKICPPQKVF